MKMKLNRSVFTFTRVKRGVWRLTWSGLLVSANLVSPLVQCVIFLNDNSICRWLHILKDGGGGGGWNEGVLFVIHRLFRHAYVNLYSSFLHIYFVDKLILSL